MYKKSKKRLKCNDTGLPIYAGDLYLHDEKTGKVYGNRSARFKVKDENAFSIRSPQSFRDNFTIPNPILDEKGSGPLW